LDEEPVKLAIKALQGLNCSHGHHSTPPSSRIFDEQIATMQRAMQRSMGHPTRGLFRVELTQPTDVCHANHGGRGVCVTSHVAQGSVLSSVRQLSDVGEATTANLWSPTKQEVLKLLSDGSLEPSLRCNVLHWIYVEADSGQLRLLLDSPILVNHEVTSLTTLATDGAPALDAATGAASPHPRWRAARDLVPGDELTENYCGGKFGQDPEWIWRLRDIVGLDVTQVPGTHEFCIGQASQ